MTPFTHLHVHSQYSLLDGQATINSLVDKAISDGMRGIALTDHGNMFGIKEFFNYVKKKNSGPKGEIKDAKKAIKSLKAAIDSGKSADPDADLHEIDELNKKIADAQNRIFTPILGCEMYVARGDSKDMSDKSDRGHHLIVLAKNEVGYHNLIKLVSKAWTEGYYYHPRTDKKNIERYREGLIISSACLGGEIPKLISSGDIEGAEASVRWWKETFGDDYYIELQRHKSENNDNTREVYEIQQKVNAELIRIARKFDIKLIATNDVHFTNQTDALAHDRLICVSTQANINDPSRMRYTKQEWLKSTEEMNNLFSDIPEAIANTMEVLDKIEQYDIDHAPIMPFFEIPAEFGTEEEYRQRLTEKDLFDEFTRDENGNVVLSQEEAEAKIEKLGGYDKLYRIKLEADYLSKLALAGAERRYGSPLSDEIAERIKFELHIMKTMGFPGYFLIVQDFITAAREKLGVSVGPGRGSAAGSAVAYCLGITQIDPLKYDLLFERFLNPDRISLPDIDIDFDDDGRGTVLQYVTEKYGEEKVAHIITYGTMATKLAIKDVARVEGLSLKDSDRLTKLIPDRMPTVDGKELKTNLSNCYKYVDGFQPELNSPDPLVRETLEYARQLEGNVRNTGVHACGVIICRDDITDWVPVSTATDKSGDTKEKLIVTQYEGKVIEETGLIKMDFLGLRTLTIIKEAVANIKHARGIDVDPDSIPIDDPKTYELYCKGETVGTFQFESVGMQKYLRELQPSTFEDLIAMNALYRPGPMDYIPDFIDRKQGKKPIEYDLPVMEKYLKDTYGITVYQEQVMLLSRLLAGFTRGQSDTLRKAMGKKLIDKMNALEKLFLEGGQKNGHDTKTLSKIWADWKKFASYAFNKSHATCYSWVAFQTAYLKANYPAEYMAAVLTCNRNNAPKLTTFMEECKRMRLPVLGPDINESFMEFGVDSKGNIRFGLAAIKGIGEGLVNEILQTREKGGKFESIYDFVERMRPGVVNRRALESFAQSGAFDCFNDHIQREDFTYENAKGETTSEILLRYGQKFQASAADSGLSLFGDDPEMSKDARPEIHHAPREVDAVRLGRERELVGMYLSAHPLDPFYMELNHGCTDTVKSFIEDEHPEGKEITFGGMVTEFKVCPGRDGSQWGIMKIEDFSASTELRLYDNAFYQFQAYGVPGTALLVRGVYKRRFPTSPVRFQIQQMQLLKEVKGQFISGITISADINKIDKTFCELMEELQRSSTVDRGTLTLNLFDSQLQRSISLTASTGIPINRRLVTILDDLGIDYRIQHNH